MGKIADKPHQIKPVRRAPEKNACASVVSSLNQEVLLAKTSPPPMETMRPEPKNAT